MQLKIQNGAVDLSGKRILNSVNIEINDGSHIAVVGRNGCGKTTLLKLISGEYDIAESESNEQRFYTVSGKAKIGVLSQITFKDDSLSMIEEIRSAYTDILLIKSQLDSAQRNMEREPTEQNIKVYTNLLDTFTNLGGFYFEKEYESAVKHFGFTEKEMQRPLREFSGGQRTKIAFLKLLLSKPDILLLDEPTNHLDIEATIWLEEYLKEYKKAFVVVSHDRMFLDNVADIVYEIEYGKTQKYVGNYTKFIENKKQLREQQAKEYIVQKREIERLDELVTRFKYKPTKAAMAQSKSKQIERMTPIEAPKSCDNRTFYADFKPIDMGVKNMLSVKDLEIGFDSPLAKINLNVEKGDKIGIIGGNGLGKSTFIKTIMGLVESLSGEYSFSNRADIGYFDQQMAQYASENTILEDFMNELPSLTQFEARSALGAFLFSGEDVFKTISVLSGGERVRLALCKIFKKRPNFLILDEPTNHMDILGKETLEELLANYEGTVIFVSHDRYFIKKIANRILEFRNNETEIFPFGYEHYLEKQKNISPDRPMQEKPVTVKKTYTTPAKEKAKRERAVKKCEEKISLLEEKLSQIKTALLAEENISDYIKLSELQTEQEQLETELNLAIEEWSELSQEMIDN